MSGDSRRNDSNMNEVKIIKEESTPGCYIKARHSLVLTQFFGSICLMFLRNNVTIAIVAMVNSTSENVNLTANESKNTCPDREESTAQQAESNGVFKWNSAEQGLILGAYFYGYVVANFPGALLAKRYGMKYTIGLASTAASVLTICTPFMAYFNLELFVVSRVLVGLFHGFFVPTTTGSWGVWGPRNERSFLISFASSGSSVGAFLNFFLMGVVAEQFGWEAVFYLSGGCCLVWSIMWMLLVFETPQEHPRISLQEKNYILQTTTQISKEFPPLVTPWKSLFTSVPTWAITVALFASNWQLSTLAAMLPTYMATILRFNVSESGYFSAIPDVLRFLLMLLAGFLTDLLQRKTSVSLLTIRKFNQTFSMLMTTLFLLLAGYVGCDATSAVILFCLAVGFSAFSIPGCVANGVDIAPRFAGILIGICNTFGNIPGFLAPQVFGWVLLEENSIAGWILVFWISAGVSVGGMLFYLIFASDEVQQWAKEDENRHDGIREVKDNPAFQEDESTNL